MCPNQTSNHGVFVGRLNPMHLGHEAVIAKMLQQFGIENSLLILGSSSAPFSLRNFFSVAERKKFVQSIFPDLAIICLPDFPTDAQWLAELDKLLLAKKFDPAKTVFFGGCNADLAFFLDAGRKCQILNRVDGTTPTISATQVRALLLSNGSLKGFLNPLIIEKVKKLFAQKRSRLKTETNLANLRK
ncbi:MAG: hypothetical protein WCJ51_02005 [Candidatus Moraniibacteriota bacterium]